MSGKRAFTLVELLVVIAIIAILAGFLLPAVMNARRRVDNVDSVNRVRQIGFALIQYADDHEGRFPDLVTPSGRRTPVVDAEGRISSEPARSAFATLLKEGHILDPRVFIARGSGDRVPVGFPADPRRVDLDDLLLPENGCSYGMDPTKTRSALPTCALVADKPPAVVDHEDGSVEGNSPNHAGDGQAVFFIGGHAEWLSTPRTGVDPDIYKGGEGYERSSTDAKIIR